MTVIKEEEEKKMNRIKVEEDFQQTLEEAVNDSLECIRAMNYMDSPNTKEREENEDKQAQACRNILKLRENIIQMYGNTSIPRVDDCGYEVKEEETDGS